MINVVNFTVNLTLGHFSEFSNNSSRPMEMLDAGLKTLHALQEQLTCWKHCKSSLSCYRNAPKLNLSRNSSAWRHCAISFTIRFVRDHNAHLLLAGTHTRAIFGHGKSVYMMHSHSGVELGCRSSIWSRFLNGIRIASEASSLKSWKGEEGEGKPQCF